MFTRIDTQIIAYVIFRGHSISCEPWSCDKSNRYVEEGNVGESPDFPWLGVLRVHIHERKSLKIALTGLVLVKKKYAIANAGDVIGIPRHVFREDSKAMFIPTLNEPWYCKVLDYIIHPEYEFTTFSTVALVELVLDDNTDNPVTPICWPKYLYDATDQLYAVGYTDEKKLLEKMIYKLQYVNHSLCDEFYNRAGFTTNKELPTNYLCAFAAHNKANCVWDNGMVLASNSTGIWTLIGFGIRGPGCAAPARFIEMYPYLQWIESATDLIPDFRRLNQEKSLK